jgi:hypothetical protein
MLLGIALGAQTNASASTLILNALGVDEEFQQTTNNPCIIGEPSCQNPAGFDRTIFPPNDATFDGFSPIYSVSQIQAITGDNFFVGLDINQNQGAQTLSLFQMLVNGVVVDTYNTTVLVPPTLGGGNGNGYADYTLTGFTSLAGLSATDTVQFHAVMSGLNDGREQFFLISDGGGGGGGSVVPEPGTLAMLGLASLALGIRRFRRVR